MKSRYKATLHLIRYSNTKQAVSYKIFPLLSSRTQRSAFVFAHLHMNSSCRFASRRRGPKWLIHETDEMGLRAFRAQRIRK